MSVLITESGVTFGPFSEERLYYIEKSDSYKELGEGFSTVEFVYINRKGQLCFVEAKSSSPRQADQIERFEEWASEVATKFYDSLQLFLTIYMQRRNEEKLGDTIRHADMKALSIKFILVIPSHKAEWLAPIQNELGKQMSKITAMWNIAVAVINKELAQEYGMIA